MRMRTLTTFGLVASIAVAAVAVGAGGSTISAPHVERGRTDVLRLDDVQVLASHNSYHVEPEPVLLDALRAFLSDESANGFEYTHEPLPTEFDAGVRSIELDLFVDDEAGGRYAAPKLVPVLGLDPVDARMSAPGAKVFHVQEVDYRSTCPTFVGCLEAVRRWSTTHRLHLPIMIQLEAKDGTIPDPGFGFVQPLPWTADTFAQLEDEIRSVFPRHRLIAPADVQGDFPTLADAVRADRWPTLPQARGKVMFTLDSEGAARDTYRQLHPDPRDRLIFAAARPPEPDAAFVVVNDPIADAATIRSLVADHFLVRTRADAETVQARTGDTTQQTAAWASGAHFVSTDYVFADPRFGTGYLAEVPGPGVARCNPVSAPPRCRPHGFPR
jgi:hypothetical protein